MEVRCTQCGASLDVSADQRLLVCPFCSTALVVEGENVLFRQAMRPTVAAAEAPAHLRRFLAGDATVAGLDREARVGEPELVFFPFWAFTIVVDGEERVELSPAAPSTLQGLHGLILPAGTSLDAQSLADSGAPVLEPEVPVETARGWLEERHEGAAIRRTVLYHLPLYRISYSWKGRSYRAAVDGVTGRVYPADFPAKAEAPYMAVAVVALVVFGLEGLIVGNLLVKLALYLVSVPPVLGLAWLVTRKV
ncbi:MAG TPA: hypothetical protein ENK19_12505 [Acidobacteria bacterium]|nr:hypothetical protein [Acidobacteriota bacterium]